MKKLLCLLLTLLLLNGCAAQPPMENLPKEPDAASSSENTASVPESESLTAEITTQPEEAYTPSDWQRTVAENKVFLTTQQRLETAAEKFDLSACNVLRVTEIFSTDLSEEQLTSIEEQITTDIFHVTFLRAADGRIFFFEQEPPFLMMGCFGLNHLDEPISTVYLELNLYYEGPLPETGKLDDVRIRSIECEHIFDADALQDYWYESMRKTPDICLYGHEEALDHYLRRVGWQGFEKMHKANGAEYYTNGELDIFPVLFEEPQMPTVCYYFNIFPSGITSYNFEHAESTAVSADGQISPFDYECGHELAKQYSISVGKESDSPVTYPDQLATTAAGEIHLESRWDSTAAMQDTLATGHFLVRMAHVLEPTLIAEDAQQNVLLLIQEHGEIEFGRNYLHDEPYLNSVLQISRDTAVKESDFGRTARQLALWQDAENPDHLWIGFQDIAQPADAPWEILGWETGGRWLEKQTELCLLWRAYSAARSVDCTDVDCICRDTLARWSAAAAPVGGNVQCSRSGKNDNTDRLAQKLLFLVQNADSRTASPAQDPAALAADGLSYLERDEGRYGPVFPDEPSALDMVYLQTDPAVAVQHDFPAQLLAWVDPAQPDDLLIATPATDGWQTACYPGWGAWLHFDLAVGAIGLP